jgi:DNA-binding MarR family transcriptional regulator
MLSRSGLTRLVDRLESSGYLKREPFADDRRGTLAVLTDAGVEELRRIWAIYSAGIADTSPRSSPKPNLRR